MKSRWNNSKARQCRNDPLELRVYSSRLLGEEPTLVLHGGGNTSVKDKVKDLFGETEEVLFIKASGWDLATIEPAGFAAVKLAALKRMAALPRLSDTDMVKAQRAVMTDPDAPNPSVEAILHAIIPFKFVDHTHADVVVAVSNTPRGQKLIHDIYGQDVLVVPYVMPGFLLARKVYQMTKTADWSKIKGIVLMHHGVLTFADGAKESYERMIRMVTQAEDFLKKKKCVVAVSKNAGFIQDAGYLRQLAALRREVSKSAGSAMLAVPQAGAQQVGFSVVDNVAGLVRRGPLTPDHMIRTKRTPVVVGRDPGKTVLRFARDYRKYFGRYALAHTARLQCLDPAPRWAVWLGKGTVAFGRDLREVQIVSDITRHTIRAIQWAEKLGGWKTLGERDLFEMEYWELEQAKLKKGGGATLPFQGKVALITGAASGIGKACVKMLREQGAVVAALDINPRIKGMFGEKEVLEMTCDVSDDTRLKECVEETVRAFGGLDILISNAGIFPPSERITDLKSKTWEKSLSLNLSSHQRLLQFAVPYLSLGLDPAVIMIASKNVPAPGPGVAAYSVAKAGLTQLARVAALELAASGIRVNVIHPNAVFDTAIWTREVLGKRAKHYGMSIEEYKTNNLLKTEVTSADVARLVCSVAGAAFSKTTGAQIPVDGGNERVI
jgi:rhamnose utilization protein RhaD (predicted bifunctional aldolase and dehydrogenase)/NAD(P)-dependent dehydrogenase (short-subunit alcohol dehydrogenase family)